jgi:hypothetical protein
MLQQMKSLQRLEICVYQSHTKVFAKKYHLFLKLEKRNKKGLMHV